MPRKHTIGRGSRARQPKQNKPTPEQIKELANNISAILTSKITPPNVYDALSGSVNDLFMPDDLTDTPEHITALLTNYYDTE